MINFYFPDIHHDDERRRMPPVPPQKPNFDTLNLKASSTQHSAHWSLHTALKTLYDYEETNEYIHLKS